MHISHSLSIFLNPGILLHHRHHCLPEPSVLLQKAYLESSAPDWAVFLPGSGHLETSHPWSHARPTDVGQGAGGGQTQVSTCMHMCNGWLHILLANGYHVQQKLSWKPTLSTRKKMVFQDNGGFWWRGQLYWNVALCTKKCGLSRQVVSDGPVSQDRFHYYNIYFKV